MPSLGQSGLDVFYAVPPSGIALGLVQSPYPDISIATPMDTYAIGNETPLNPSLSFEERYRWVLKPALTMSDVNVVLNPLLQYTDPTNPPLNVPPPNWVFHNSSQTRSDRWKFYPYVHVQSSYARRFPMSEIHPAGVGETFTVMFPCGFAFLYSPNQIIPSNPTDLYCTLGARCGSVQLNVPYVLEIYYSVYARLPSVAPPVYPPSTSTWKDSVYVQCDVYGLNSSGVTTENPFRSVLRHRATSNTRFRLRHIALDNRSSIDADWETPVRRWVVGTNVLFTAPATVSAEITVKVAGIPGFALLGVLMYPLSEIRAAAKDTNIHPTMYTFNADLRLSSNYGGRLNGTSYHYLPHGFDGPLRYYASIDQSAYSGQPPSPALNAVRFYRHTSGLQLSVIVRDVMSKPPSLTYASGAPPEMCSYRTDDLDARPSIGVLPVPYTGGYTSEPLFITQGQTKLSYDTPSSRPYANWVDFLTDDIPVRPGIMYRLVLDTYFSSYFPPSSYPYPNNAAPYMRFSYMCYQAAVLGYDKDNNMVEIAFLAPFAPANSSGSGDYDIYRSGLPSELSRVVTTSLIGSWSYTYNAMSRRVYYNTMRKRWPDNYFADDVGYPNPSYPFGYIIFNNPSVVKARVAISIVQPYVRRSSAVVFSGGLPPGNDTTPYLLLPPPDIDFNVKQVGLHELWPVPYTTGGATFLEGIVADFISPVWVLEGSIRSDSTAYDYPGHRGGINVSAASNSMSTGTARLYLTWSQSSEMYVWPCIRMRFRTVRSTSQAPPTLNITLRWRDRSGYLHSLLSRLFYLAEELFTYGQVTSLGGGWYEVDLPLGYAASLNSPYPTSLEIVLELSCVDNTSLTVGYFNVGFYDDEYGRSTRRVLVPAGFGAKVTIDTPYRPPRVVGVEQISRYHWGVRIRPGLVYERYIIPSDESDHSWLIRAGFNRGDDVVLVYSLPEYTATFVGGVPVSRRVETVTVRSGVFQVERPVHSGMQIRLVAEGGVVLTGDGNGSVFKAAMFGREVTITSPSMSSYNGSAEVTYHYYSPDYVYTGCWFEGSTGPVPAVFNLSAHSKSGLLVGPFSRQVLTQQYPALSYSQAFHMPMHAGVSIYLLPSMVIPYSRFVRGDRVGVRLPAHLGAVRSYVRHILGSLGFSHRSNLHDSWQDPPRVYHSASMAALRIAYITLIPTLGWACVDLSDIRTRGGGLPSVARVDVPGAYWDISDWDGGYTAGAGRAIVRLPKSLLFPESNRDAFSHEHIVNLVNSYLPAGIDYEVEYVD